MGWSPWIEHDGRGQPDFSLGTRLLLELRDPAEGMQLVDQVEVCVGDGPIVNEEKEWMMDGNWDGESWTLPVKPGFLYIPRYRIWRDLEKLFGIESLDVPLSKVTETVKSPWAKPQHERIT